MDNQQLDILAALDTELPIVDPKIHVITACLLDLVDADTLRRYDQGYRAGLRRFLADYQAGAPFSVEDMFAAVHETLPEDIDPAVLELLDDRLARFVEVGANIAAANSPL
jgi:hypothetical protein